MKNNTSLTASPKQMLRFQEKLGGILIKNYGVCTLEFNNSYGYGSIKHYHIKNEFSVIDFNITLHSDLVFNVCDEGANLLNFIYCTEGKGFYKHENNEHFIKIEELRPGIINCKQHLNNHLKIKKNLPFILNVITINKEDYFKKFAKFNEGSSNSLDSYLMDFDTLGAQLHQSAFNLKIAEKLRAVRNEHIIFPISCLLRIESLFTLILAQHLEQFYKEKHEAQPIASLSKSELQKIRQLTDFIIQSPEIQHSIGSLCAKITMSPAKLQEGFKGMHNTTVADFVRNVRIEKAERLLNETDLNISEIVYSIGLTSRSYFCKIFKNKYNYSPKKYRKIIRQNTMAQSALEA